MKQVIKLTVVCAVLIVCLCSCCWGNFIFPYPLIEPRYQHHHGEELYNSNADNRANLTDTISKKAPN